MQMQFGQFLDHDITLTPESEAKGCCTNQGLSGVFARDCFPINFACNDPTFSNLGSTYTPRILLDGHVGFQFNPKISNHGFWFD